MYRFTYFVIFMLPWKSSSEFIGKPKKKTKTTNNGNKNDSVDEP